MNIKKPFERIINENSETVMGDFFLQFLWVSGIMQAIS